MPIRGGVSERGKIMMMNMLYVFSDINGRIVYQPYDSLKEYAKDGKLEIEKLRR